ncbi:MAG: ATP-dependent Clp protease adaptor ClpS [Bacteroidales bacterium]|nr:ATP-dependent Clp protease adaptor ClpS [Bacteroidales bacterium]
MFKNKKKENPEENNSLSTINGNNQSLILYNDDYHTFDFVIETLINICRHNDIQAEQCAYIVHYKGKCDVKNGDYDLLKPIKEALTDRGLKANIE